MRGGQEVPLIARLAHYDAPPWPRQTRSRVWLLGKPSTTVKAIAYILTARAAGLAVICAPALCRANAATGNDGSGSAHDSPASTSTLATRNRPEAILWVTRASIAPADVFRDRTPAPASGLPRRFDQGCFR
jgi:hypothetical protein